MKSPLYRAVGRLAPRFGSGVDSTSAMVNALGSFLRGHGSWSEGLASAVDALATWAGAEEGIPPERLGDVRVEELSRWVAGLYPEREYPAAFVGAGSGAILHLAAALGAPFLPQTFLIPIRRVGPDPDEPRDDLAWGRDHAGPLLLANPDVQLHHVHDPCQDRLEIRRMAHFRVKRLRLGPAYERFLLGSLQPGAAIHIADCRRTWPATRVSERHLFQFGAPGGATASEYFHGSERVAEYLARHESHRKAWDPPPPDGEAPEAEWGLEPAFGEDVDRFAAAHGFRVRRLVFQEPDDPSPLVADLHRWWYRQRRLRAGRLLVESSLLVDPWWTLRTGSVPFWMLSSVERSAERLERYLDGADPFDSIHLTLFSHGVKSVGVAPIERWRSILSRARKEGSFAGVDPERYPHDLGVHARLAGDLERIPSRYAVPGPLSETQLDAFRLASEGRYPVEWLEEAAAVR